MSEMRCSALILPAIMLLAGFPLKTKASIITMGTAGDFAVLAGSTVTGSGVTIIPLVATTGPSLVPLVTYGGVSVINGGDVGVSPGSAIAGFPPATVVLPYTIDNAGAAAAQNDLTVAYNAAAGLTPTQTLTGVDLGGLMLTPGVYAFATSADLTGTLTLNNQGDPNAQFVFQIGTELTTASNSSVVSINDDGSSMPGCTVFWQVGDSATLGIDTTFEGHILALNNITLNPGATILDGSALARDGAVELDSNSITNGVGTPDEVQLPEPTTTTLALIGGAMLCLRRSSSGSRSCENHRRNRGRLCKQGL
jgi:hypothetical protein